MKGKLAFTFIEVLITLTVFSVMIACLYTTLHMGQKAWVRYAKDIIPQQQVRRAMITLNQELREAENINLIHEKDKLQIRYTNSQHQLSEMNFYSEGKQSGQLIRIFDKEKEPIIAAYGLNQLSLKMPDDQHIQYEIRGGDQNQFVLNGYIALRMNIGLIAQGRHESINE